MVVDITREKLFYSIVYLPSDGLHCPPADYKINWFVRLLSQYNAPAMPIPKNKERPEKILVAMYELSDGTTKSLKYEDIVVKAFELFPDEFSLRGYPQYPDSSDIHKPLYGPLTRQGFVRAAHKSFALTASGVEFARKLKSSAGDKLADSKDAERLSRDAEAEVERMLQSAALRFFVERKKEKILDTDFYAFLGCTVRTPRNEFLGCLERSERSVEQAGRLRFPNPDGAAALTGTLKFLKTQFKDLISRRREGK